MTSRSIRRRATLAIAVVAAIVCVFVVRLVDIQVVNADALNAQSFDKRSVDQSIMGLRGNIVDSSGSVLAETVIRYTVTASPKNVGEFSRTVDGVTSTVSAQQAASEIGNVIGLSGDQVYASLVADPASNYLVVAKDLDVDRFRAIQKLEIPWIYFESNQSRSYPNGAVGGNLVGFTGEDGAAQAGLEMEYNSCLQGANGTQVSEQGADGVTIPGSTVVEKPAQDGSQLVTTIDKDLQWQVQQVVTQSVKDNQAQWGIGIVVEAKTGKILAAGEAPTVDPGNVDAADPSSRGARVFNAPVEPGSTFKAITASALIDSGAATPLSQVEVPYRYTFGDGSVITDSGGHPVQQLTLNGVMINSSNVGISKLATNMSVDQRFEYMKAFGFGSDTGVGFPGEDSGTIRTPADWDDQTTHNSTFGQGITVTPMQLAGAYQAIANGGQKIPLQLVEGCRAADGTMTNVPNTTPSQVISSASARQVTDMMENVADHGYAKDYIAVPGYRIAAKTGTAELSNGSGAYGGLFYTSLAGFAPAENPQYVVYVGIYKPAGSMGGSSLAAAPAFQQITSYVLKKYRVTPSTEPAPVLPATY